MALDPQAMMDLYDAAGHCLGQVALERIEGDRVFGQFAPSGSFGPVRDLFLEFEEAVNEQLFSEADRLGREIDRLGLRLQQDEQSETLQIGNVQIMNGSDFACRVPNLGLTHLRREVVQAG